MVAHAGLVDCRPARLPGIARPLDHAGVTRVLAARDGQRVVRSVNEIAHVTDLLPAPS